MNLTDLQVELRGIEDHLAVLHNEIEKMKPKTDEEKKTDYEAITRLASKHPLRNETIGNTSDDVRKQFFSGLSYILLSSEKDIYARLLYLTRMSVGCGLNWSAEDIYKNGLAFENTGIDKFCVEMQEYAYTFLVEAFVLASLTESASPETFTIISDVAKLMNCDKEEIRFIAQVAKCKLSENTDLLLDLPVP